MQPTPVLKDVLLVGGGHSHVLLIRQWAMRPLAGVRLTLVSRDVMTPYSGMLPGLLAGHYTYDDVHIDLLRLCNWAGVRFIEAEVTDLDLDARCVVLRGRPPLGCDLLSLDTGSVPSLDVPGAAEFSVPVKPVSTLYERWQQMRTSARPGQRIGVVGSGAGGFELVMAIHHALSGTGSICHWFIRGDRALGERPPRVASHASQAAISAGIELHRHFDVVAVTCNAVQAADGRRVELDHVLWCTGAEAPAWPARAGLAVDDRGFIATNERLQSVSHPWVFASGDIGSQVRSPSPKAGVFAVRQAPVLARNLRRALLRQPLTAYRPQRRFLALMAEGKRSAIASWGGFYWRGRWVWRWKDSIDRRFMRRFSDLPIRRDMPYRVSPALRLLYGSGLEPRDLSTDIPRCSGCGAKIGDAMLNRVIDSLSTVSRKDVRHGALSTQSATLSITDDVAIIDPQHHWLVQSVDQMRGLIDDPYLFGRIATLHALSDVATQECDAQSAQVLVELPFAADPVVERELSQLLMGVVSALNEAGCALIGGHTAEAADMQLALVINALLDPAVAERQRLAGAGDALILTQPLGSGILFAGLMQGRARGTDILCVLASMNIGNGRSADILRRCGASRITDVTGFGLLGHAQKLLEGQGLEANFDIRRIPVFPGAMSLAENNVHSSLWRHNQRFLVAFSGIEEATPAQQRLLTDPQTGGGLLAALPASRAQECVRLLRSEGYPNAAVIGSLSHDEQTLPDIAATSGARRVG